LEVQNLVISAWFPANVSTYGGQIDHVIDLIFMIVAIWFVLAQGTIIYFAIRYRRKPGVKAQYVQGDNLKQGAWILVPALLVLVCDLSIDAAGGRAWETVKGSLPPPDMAIQVTGKQFAWLFTYPAADGRFDTGKNLTENSLHVPVGRVVHVVLQSDDVIHDFFVPELRLKQDIVPGRKITAWFEVTKAGTYEIACSQLCGPAHFGMKAQLVAESPADYQAWLKSERSAADKKTANLTIATPTNG
jgi:cytochrome c oxidase subunit 2